MRLSSSQIEAIKQESENSFGAQAEAWLFDSRMDNNQCGFTLVELVMTMVIIGILAAVVAPRFFDNNVFQSRGFADQVQTSLRYAQKVAIAQRRFVCVTFTASTVSLSTGTTNACGTPLPSLTGSGNYVVTSPASNITIAPVPATLDFNGLGQPNAATTVVTGGSTITVEAETGYVHSP